MYNLFVSGDDEQWKRTVWEIEAVRAVRKGEYTREDIAEKLSALDEASINELKSYPCLFVYEGAWNKDAHIGWLNSIKKNGNMIRIEYEFIDPLQRISAAKIEKLKLELDLNNKYEIGRTHWAVKDADLFLILKNADIISEGLFNKLTGRVSVNPGQLKIYGAKEIIEFHDKTLARVEEDPDGAITSARSLLESVCKQILEKRFVHCANDDLPKLHGKVAKELNLAPSAHSEEAVKRILGGCFSVIEGLGALRNSLGDAHGRGLNSVKPDVRHARLAVNFSTAAASYLLETDNAFENSNPSQNK